MSRIGSFNGTFVNGLDARAEFREFGYELDPGDRVILYTDGVVEAQNRSNELYGESRLIAAIREAPPGTDALVRAITVDVKTFAAGQPQSDDVTIVSFALA